MPSHTGHRPIDCIASIASLRTLGHGAVLGPAPRKPKQAALLLDHRRRICAVEFLVAQVDQVRAGRKTRPRVERRQKRRPPAAPVAARPAHVEQGLLTGYTAYAEQRMCRHQSPQGNTIWHFGSPSDRHLLLSPTCGVLSNERLGMTDTRLHHANLQTKLTWGYPLGELRV